VLWFAPGRGHRAQKWDSFGGKINQKVCSHGLTRHRTRLELDHINPPKGVLSGCHVLSTNCSAVQISSCPAALLARADSPAATFEKHQKGTNRLRCQLKAMA